MKDEADDVDAKQTPIACIFCSVRSPLRVRTRGKVGMSCKGMEILSFFVGV